MSTPDLRRRFARRAAAALAAAGLGIGVAAPAASAEEAPYDFQTGAFPEAEYWYTDGAHVGVPQPGSFYANPLLEGDETVASFEATLSVPSEYGITLITEDENCTSDGTTIACLYVDTTWGAEVDFDLVADGGIPAGEEIEYTISVTADGYDTEYFSDLWQFETEEDEYIFYDVEASGFTDVEPGTSVTPEIAIANPTDTTFKGTYVTLTADEEFLTVAADYSNCGELEPGYLVCVLPEFSPEPGTVYELDPNTPVTVTLAENAPGPITYRAWFEASPVGPFDEVDFFDADEELAFVESDRDSVEGWGLIEIESAENLYDLAVSDQVVGSSTLAIPVGNNGPAAAFARQHPGSGEGDFAVSVQLPTGVTIGETDEGVIDGGSYFCAVADAFEWFGEIDPAVYGVERLDVQCWIYDTIAADGAVEIELPVVIADGASAADGLVVAQLDTTGWDFDEFEENWPDLSEEDYPVLDADLENNTAKLSVGDGSGSGQLPVTGSALTAVIGAAAAALVAGAVLFVLRRRKAAANW
jgi:LPXTG-motif cell wall-anchored protein